MKKNLTSLASDRHVLGVWLDDKHTVAEHAALAALKAIEDQIMSPSEPEWRNPLIQSVFAEQYMRGWGRYEHKIVSVPRSHGKTQLMQKYVKEFLEGYNKADAELTKALWKRTVEDIGVLNEAFDYAAVEMRAAATMLCDSMCTLCNIVDRKNVKETLHAWKKTQPVGGTPPSKRSCQGRA